MQVAARQARVPPRAWRTVLDGFWAVGRAGWDRVVRRILVAENERRLAELVKAFPAEQGHAVLVVFDGKKRGEVGRPALLTVPLRCRCKSAMAESVMLTVTQ